MTTFEYQRFYIPFSKLAFHSSFYFVFVVQRFSIFF